MTAALPSSAGHAGEAPCRLPAAASSPAQDATPSVDSSGLLQGGRILTIRHRGELYRLQETRQGKLILTK